jgi:hypothetical protein
VPKTLRLLTAVAATVFGLIPVGCSYPPLKPGWVMLIDGGNGIENFDRFGDANWRVEDGALVADKGTGNSYLLSKNTYSDFRLRAEFWADHTTNSGIHLRCQEPANVTDRNSYEVNIFDRRTDPNYGTGGIVNFARVIGAPKTGGQWNTYEITAKGDEIVVTLNGVRTAELKHGAFTRGRIALQYGANPGGAIKWRRVQIWPL